LEPDAVSEPQQPHMHRPYWKALKSIAIEQVVGLMAKLRASDYDWRANMPKILFFSGLLLVFMYIAKPKEDGTVLGNYSMRPMSWPKAPATQPPDAGSGVRQ
jgi:hypothetical protein